jgi:hypothetical protein
MQICDTRTRGKSLTRHVQIHVQLRGLENVVGRILAKISALHEGLGVVV